MKSQEEDITIIETAQAARAIEELKPDIVAFEFCRDCSESIIGQEDTQEALDIYEFLGGSKILLFLVQIFMANRFKKIGDEGNANQGSEIQEAIAAAKKTGARMESLDVNESAILERFCSGLSFRDKIRLLRFAIKVKINERKEENQEASLSSNDAVSQMISDLSPISPAASDALKMEYDLYLAAKLHQLSMKGRLLVVVDAVYRIKGALEYLETGIERLETKRESDSRISLVKILGTALTLLVLGVMALVLANAPSSDKVVPAFVIWFAITGGLSALGVILARGHPLSAFTALMVAWLTTLIPFVAAGLFAGTVEAWKQKPTVGDFRRLSRMRSLDQMKQNRLFKVLLVTVMANLGGIAGMFLGVYIIWQRLGLINPADLIGRLH